MERRAGPHGFDGHAFFAALDGRRRQQGLSWAHVAKEMWELNADFSAQHEHYHPIAVTTITKIARTGDTTCQHALVMLRWLERAPEEFIVQPRPGTAGVPLPAADPAHMLRWDLNALYTALNERRISRGATWAQAAGRLYCTPNQLTGLRTAKFATGMRLAMRICQALARPSAEFIYAADW